MDFFYFFSFLPSFFLPSPFFFLPRLRRSTPSPHQRAGSSSPPASPSNTSAARRCPPPLHQRKQQPNNSNKSDPVPPSSSSRRHPPPSRQCCRPPPPVTALLHPSPPLSSPHQRRRLSPRALATVARSPPARRLSKTAAVAAPMACGGSVAAHAIISFPFHTLPSMPIIFSLDTNSFHPLQRRERRRAHESSRARSKRRRGGIVAVAIDLDQVGPSRRAIVFASYSSPFPLKNHEEWSSEEGDRPHLPQHLPLTSIFDSSRSGCLIDRAIAVHPRRSAAAEPFHEPPLTTKVAQHFLVPRSMAMQHIDPSAKI
nr:proline-rich receptor-like protein kinase PERK9 isoform X2 [Oryza sativa Japonica Group]